MENFITFLEDHVTGIFLFLLLLLCLILFFNWLAWVFGMGRYKNLRPTPKSGFFYIFADMMVKIITDFRHFLALILVIIFAIALAYAFSISNGNIDNLSKALQAVVSTLGGLVGSIVGYYFGESAARSSNQQPGGINNPAATTSTSTPPVQGSTTPTPSTETIKEVKLPDNFTEEEEE